MLYYRLVKGRQVYPGQNTVVLKKRRRRGYLREVLPHVEKDQRVDYEV